MITKTYHAQGLITAEELESFIRKEGFYDSYYFDFCLKGVNFVLSHNEFNPFEEQDYTPTLLSLSRRYTYGVKELEDKDGTIRHIQDFEDYVDLEVWLDKNGYIYKPFEKYEHSTLAFRLLEDTTDNLTCRFDSCIGGYLVMKKSDLKAYRNVKKLSEKILEDEFKLWKQLLNEFENYVNGNQFTLSINDTDYYDFECVWDACEIIANYLNAQEKAS